MSNLDSMMAEDAASRAAAAPTDEQLKTVSELAAEQLRLERAVEEQENLLKDLKDNLAKVREFDLPNAIESFGLSEFKLLDGSSITIKEDVYAGITEDHREAAFKWLEETGNDGIIKNEVKVPFGKGQDSESKQLVELLNAQGYSFINARTVHPQTLKAFVRKQLEDGKPLAMDLLSVHVKKIASIKRPK